VNPHDFDPGAEDMSDGTYDGPVWGDSIDPGADPS
jgi:hypothetical protein